MSFVLRAFEIRFSVASVSRNQATVSLFNFLGFFRVFLSKWASNPQKKGKIQHTRRRSLFKSETGSVFQARVVLKVFSSFIAYSESQKFMRTVAFQFRDLEHFPPLFSDIAGSFRRGVESTPFRQLLLAFHWVRCAHCRPTVMEKLNRR